MRGRRSFVLRENGTEEDRAVAFFHEKRILLMKESEVTDLKNKGISDAIRTKIESFPVDAVFTAKDLTDVAYIDNVRHALKALADAGVVDRIARGLYHRPKFSAYLGENVPPDIDDAAHAIARSRGWSIAPSGDHALNMIGLDTQVPSVYSYVSDGPYAKQAIGPYTVEFKHTANKDIASMSPTTLLVVHALKALGKEGVKPEHLDHIARRLDDEQKQALLEETTRTSEWVRAAIVGIARKDRQ